MAFRCSKHKVHTNKGQCREKTKLLVMGPAIRILATSLQKASRSHLPNKVLCMQWFSEEKEIRLSASSVPLTDRLFRIPEVVNLENRLPEPFSAENILPTWTCSNLGLSGPWLGLGWYKLLKLPSMYEGFCSVIVRDGCLWLCITRVSDCAVQEFCVTFKAMHAATKIKLCVMLCVSVQSRETEYTRIVHQWSATRGPWTVRVLVN